MVFPNLLLLNNDYMRKYLFLALFALTPITSLAASNDVWDLWNYALWIIGRLTQIAWVLTIVTFLFGLVQFLQKADDPKAQANAKLLMKGSVIAFTIAVSFWGLITFVISSLDIAPGNNSSGIQLIDSNS